MMPALSFSSGTAEFTVKKAELRLLWITFSKMVSCLYYRASRILATPQDAEDSVQEAMVAAFTHLHQFEGRADFLTWATRIVINASLQHIREEIARRID